MLSPVTNEYVVEPTLDVKLVPLGIRTEDTDEVGVIEISTIEREDEYDLGR